MLSRPVCLDPAAIDEGIVGRFLLCRLLIASVSCSGNLLAQHDLDRKLAIMRGAFLAHKSVRGRDAVLSLRQFLKQRLVIFEEPFCDDLLCQRLQAFEQELARYLDTLIQVDRPSRASKAEARTRWLPPV